jgi:putative peptide maturation dehydrogenase
MARIKRPRYVCFYSEDFPFPKIDEFLRGRVEKGAIRKLYAFSILRGETVELSSDELELVLDTPSEEWVEAEDEERSRSLARRGVLLVDDEEGELAGLRRREERLAELNWNLESAVYHFAARWRGVDLREDAADLPPPGADAVREFVDAFGMPPPAFSSRDGERVQLPAVEREGQLYDALMRRRTTRSFDLERPLSTADLAVVLRYVFGYHGYARLFGEITTLKRTSPSAGGFHSVEAYPILLRVDGVPPGLYRYDGRDHVLEPVASIAPGEGRELAARFVCGQTYFADAHALVVLAVRFERAFWKYRNHQKALAAVLMDAAHLSQTLYLVSTELGLGAFVTAAVNNADIDERLGLDGYGDGTVAVCGFGIPAAERSPFDPVFEPLGR